YQSRATWWQRVAYRRRVTYLRALAGAALPAGDLDNHRLARDDGYPVCPPRRLMQRAARGHGGTHVNDRAAPQRLLALLLATACAGVACSNGGSSSAKAPAELG